MYDEMIQFGRELGLSEQAAKVFATGRHWSEAAAREAWSGRAGQSGRVPAELAGEVERSVAAEAAAFGLSREVAARRVGMLVEEQLPDTAAARRALVAHQYRLGARR